MRVLLSKAERDFLENLIKGKIDQYSYHYKKVLKKRILDKRKELTEDISFDYYRSSWSISRQTVKSGYEVRL